MPAHVPARRLTPRPRSLPTPAPPTCPCAISILPVPAGAPPDYFDPNGQNWGFPTYNWEEMGKDSYLWWRRRLTHMAQ